MNINEQLIKDSSPLYKKGEFNNCNFNYLLQHQLKSYSYSTPPSTLK